MTTEPNPVTNPGGDGEDIGVTAASQGQKTGHIRWVLVIGSCLAVAVLAVVWISMGGFH